MAIETPKLGLTKGTVFEKMMCKHEEFEELGTYKKLRCKKCGKTIYVEVKK